MKNPGCRVQPGFDYRLRELVVVHMRHSSYLAPKISKRMREPWSAVSADDKPYVRLIVARILADTLMRLELRYPVLDHDRTSELRDMRRMLRSETAKAVSDRLANQG